MERAICQAITKGGKHCQSFALPSGYCQMHDPAKAEVMAQARIKGSVKAAKLRALKNKRKKLTTLPALIRFTSDVIQDIHAGALTPEIGRTVLYGVSIQRQLVEPSDIEKRLGGLEALAVAVAENGAKK